MRALKKAKSVKATFKINLYVISFEFHIEW